MIADVLAADDNWRFVCVACWLSDDSEQLAQLDVIGNKAGRIGILL
jgi:hypothetical protein